MTVYRAENLGSFMRPPELLDARKQVAEGKLSQEALRKLEDQAILTVLDVEKQAGLNVFTDGEYRRQSWQGDISMSADGMVAGEPEYRALWRGPGGGTQNTTTAAAPQGLVTAKLHRKGRFLPAEAPFMAKHAPGPFKITMPSMGQFPFRYKRGLSDKAYPTRGAMLMDLAGIMAQEVDDLVHEGAKYIHVDAPYYICVFGDPNERTHLREAGIDPDQLLADSIAADNVILKKAKQMGATAGFHLCRGNAGRDRWIGEASYESIAEKTFGGLQADTFLLEYDSERAGGFEPLRFVPRGKTVVLGIVSTKTPELESMDDLGKKIDAAAKFVPLENLAVSTQCGFHPTRMTWDEQRRKLELVATTARKVWG